MRCAFVIHLGVFIVCFLVSRGAAAKPSDAFEAQLVEQLRATAPQAVSSFERANQLRETAPAEAAALYAEVARAAPGFSAAKRRRCNVLLRLERRAEGLADCRAAVEQDPSALNLAGLANALAVPGGDARDRAEAKTLLDRAATVDPAEPHVVEVRCGILVVDRALTEASECARDLSRRGAKEEAGTVWSQIALAHLRADGGGLPDVPAAARAVGEARTADPVGPEPERAACAVALHANDEPDLRTCSEKLRRVAPNDPAGYLFSAVSAASSGDFDRALGYVDEARAHGLAAETADDLAARIRSSMPLHLRWGPRVAKLLVAWVSAFAILFGLGTWLSRRVLAHAESSESDGTAQATVTEQRFRRTYAAVLWASCALYWISLPLVAVLVAAIGAGLVVGMLAIGHIPVKLLLIVVVVVAATLWAILKGVFARVPDEDPGERLDVSAHPRLAETLRDVAAKVGTRPVDTVFVTPGTDIAVFERGGMLKQLRGRTERCLVLGAGVLDGMDLAAFKAILAHEYGHFSNRDTAGGGFALAVRRSLLKVAIGLAEAGAAAWYNPAWLFLLGFQNVFLRISQGASRLQEILADRWAAVTYGAAAFERGLRHVVARGVHFDAHANATLTEVIEGPRVLANLYTYTPAAGLPADGSLEKEIEEALDREPHPFDSHPSPSMRFRLVRKIAEPAATPDADASAWDLFANRREIERWMTTIVRDRIRESHGVDIVAKEPKKKGGAAPVEPSTDAKPEA